MMQNYLVERRQDIKEVQTYEKMMESRRDEKLIQQFREKISKKTKSNQRKGRIRNISTAAAVTIMMIMGGTMYYYAGQDQSINFKEVVMVRCIRWEKGCRIKFQQNHQQNHQQRV